MPTDSDESPLRIDHFVLGMRKGEGYVGNLWYWTRSGWQFGPVGYRARVRFKTRRELRAVAILEMPSDGRLQMMSVVKGEAGE